MLAKFLHVLFSWGWFFEDQNLKIIIWSTPEPGHLHLRWPRSYPMPGAPPVLQPETRRALIASAVGQKLAQLPCKFHPLGLLT